MAQRPGVVRDAIISFLQEKREATVAEIRAAVEAKLGPVPSSSVRSYLGNNVPHLFARTAHARYRLKAPSKG